MVPVYPFLGEGLPTKIDYRQKGTLILTSLLEDLVSFFCLLHLRQDSEVGLWGLATSFRFVVSLQ